MVFMEYYFSVDSKLCFSLEIRRLLLVDYPFWLFTSSVIWLLKDRNGISGVNSYPFSYLIELTIPFFSIIQIYLPVVSSFLRNK